MVDRQRKRIQSKNGLGPESREYLPLAAKS
jgi:hypothetical protein